MNNARCVITMVTTASLITGCVSLPPLDDSPASAGDVLSQISKRQTAYSEAINQNGQYNQGYNLLMISVGVISVAAAVFSHGAAKGNIIAGAGIAAGALALGYSASDRSARTSALLTGIHQLSCLRSRIVTSQIGTPSIEQMFNDQVQNLDSALSVAQTVLGQHMNTDAGYSDLNTTISVAKVTLSSANGEIDSYAQLNDLSIDTFFSIDSQVTTALQGTLLTYANVTKAITPSAAPAPTAVAAPVPANTQAPPAPPMIAPTNSNLLGAVQAVATNRIMVNKQYSTAATQIPQCATVK
ncbi:hypothetical protein [Paraburkholderia sediminicola]|uniref:hypothetical protein n=1 Tax=Paraburkholderia sediminicola TaxID=458836 RepID=UPI0038B6F4DD